MPKKMVDPLALINKSIAGLEKAGLRQSLGDMTLDPMFAPMLAQAKAIAVAVTLPQDDSLQTVDVTFDEKTGNIIGWKKTPKEVSKGNVTLKMLAKVGTGLLPGGTTKTFIFDKVFKSAIKEIAEEIDEAIKDKEVLQRFDKNLKLPALKPTEKTAMAGQRVLLLVHGIFSKTEAAFRGLTDVYENLKIIYGDRMIAYDHFTLSKSTKENAADLLAQLPDNTQIDIVCHSRGAGVVRFLVEQKNNRIMLDQKGIKIGTVCFVAGACEGSPLATKEAADSLFRVLTELTALSGVQATIGFTAFGLLIRATISGVQEFPGVKSMDPFGADILALAGSEKTAAAKYGYIRANFDPKNSVLRLTDDVLLDLKVFKKAANDVIVPWKGASASTTYLPLFTNKVDLLGYDKTGAAQGDVWHINFFGKPLVQTTLLDVLKLPN